MSFTAVQSRRFWILFLLSAVIAAVAAFRLMYSNVPLLKVDIHFSRAEAVAAAKKFQQRQFPGLTTTRTAASFITDRELQNYVELEGGGLAAYQQVINNLDAVTNYWRVRRFSEGQEKELTTAFSPTGQQVSYWLTIPEKEPGAALDEASARAIAERGARDLLGERFNAYKPFDSDMKKQTSGRIDYTFTFEHESLKLGEARFRLKVRVAGDQLVGVDTFNHIPEAFTQRFNEMRAVNNHISQAANFLMAGLLGLGGLVGGGIWLYRRHQLQWKRALVPSVIVALGMSAASLSNLPMAWMTYDTTVSASNFLLRQLAAAGLVLLVYTLFLSVIYAVAEGLTRMAFADHPRLFDFGRRPVAASRAALGRVLGAYGWTGFFLLYAIVFVIFSSKVLGWWQPTDLESDPNILASWRPALGPIFNALQAGTWEECLFRAIPLSLAAILGTHFGMRRPLILVVLVLQALIFGAAHANYPNLPGYSRLVELFIPAMAFGIVYLRFGLVVGMVTHFTYDLVLMSLPIFSVADSSLWIDQALVVLAGLTPLLVLLWARYRQGSFVSLAAQWRNGVPPVVPADEPVATAHVSTTWTAKPIKPGVGILAAILIGASIVLFFAWKKAPEVQWPPFTIDRLQAKAAAEAELAKHGITLTGEWRETILTATGTSTAADFVWREAGKDTFQRLLGTYLDTPYWTITWRKFDGPVEQRSERWEAWLYPDGSLHELVHVLPEAAAGAKLTRDQAKAKALNWITEHHWGDPAKLEEKSIEETQRPARSDWVLKYFDKNAFNVKDGQALIRITISGDEVTGFFRGVDVPDEWQRKESGQNSAKTPFKIGSMVLVLALVGLAISGFLRKHSGGKIQLGLALPWIALGVIPGLVVAILWRDAVFSSFQPTMSWSLQAWTALGGALLVALALGVLMLFLAQAIHGERPLPEATASADFILGASLALALVAGITLIKLLVATTASPQPYVADWVTDIPWLTAVFNGLKSFVVPVIQLVLIIGIIRFAQKQWQVWLVLVLSLAWWVVSSLVARELLLAFLNQGMQLLTVFLLIQLVLRRQMGAAIAMAGCIAAFWQFGVARALYATAPYHALLSVVCALMVTYGLVWHWHKYGHSKSSPKII